MRLLNRLNVGTEPAEIHWKLPGAPCHNGSHGATISAKSRIRKLRFSPSRHDFLDHKHLRVNQRTRLVIARQQRRTIFDTPSFVTGETIEAQSHRWLEDDGKRAFERGKFLTIAGAERPGLIQGEILREAVQEPFVKNPAQHVPRRRRESVVFRK